jgi:serine/threonine protein kinase
MSLMVTLFDHLAKRGKLDELPAKVTMWQMLEGLAYLHNNNIVYRGIKPENVLIAGEGAVSIQLTDFIFAVIVDPSRAAPATEMKSMVGYV